MDKGRALELLRDKLEQIPSIKEPSSDNKEFRQWCADVRYILEDGFGKDSQEYRRFTKAVVRQSFDSDSEQREANLTHLDAYENVLKSILRNYEKPEEVEARAVSEENIKYELEQFLKKLKRFRQNQIRVGDTGTSKSLEKLREELIRTSARLRRVIAPPDGTFVIEQMGVAFDIFDGAFMKPVYPWGIPTQWHTAVNLLIQKTIEAIGRLEAVQVSQLPQEAVYPSGKLYDAYKDIKDILTAATKKLIIVDPYVDSTLFTMLESVQPKVQIQILTRKMGSDFQLVGQKFKGQREKAQQGKLEIRKSGKLHDRFIVADEKAFQIGASIKDAGTHFCAINEFQGSNIKTILKKTISGYWAEAEIVL